MIWTLTPGAAEDPLTVVKQLLYAYLEQVEAQHYQETMRHHWRDGHKQER